MTKRKLEDEDFEIYLFSNGSMDIFPENTLASFSNILADTLTLDGTWQVALSEITFPTLIENVSDPILAYSIEGKVVGNRYEERRNKRFYIERGLYKSVDVLLETIKKKGEIDIEWNVNPISRKVKIRFPFGNRIEFITYPEKNSVGHILGFDQLRLGQKVGDILEAVPDEENFGVYIEGKYPVDLNAGRFLMFVNINFIDYQRVCNTKVPTLRVVPLLGKMKNDELYENSAENTTSFTDLQYKHILSNTLQRIVIELRDEMGNLVPFLGRGRTAITLKFHKISDS